jgi:hypothetical protein
MLNTEAKFVSLKEQFKGFFEKDQWVTDDEYRRLIRELCIRAIFARWSVENEPSDYEYIKGFILERMQDLPKYRIPDRETLERRIRETADPKLFPFGISPCVRIGRGTYIPNPAMFSGEERIKLEKLIKK